MNRFILFLFFSGLSNQGQQGITAFIPSSNRALFVKPVFGLTQINNQDNIEGPEVIPDPREPSPPDNDSPGIDHINPIPESMKEPSVNPTNADSDVPDETAGRIPDWPTPVQAPRVPNHHDAPSDCPGLPPQGMDSLPPSIQEPNVY